VTMPIDEARDKLRRLIEWRRVALTEREKEAIRAILAENAALEAALAEAKDLIAKQREWDAARSAALVAKDAELVRLIDKAAAIIGSEYRNVGVVEAAIDWLAGKRDQARQRAERAERIISREERISDSEMMALLRRVNKDFEAEIGEFNEHLSMLASTLACGMPGKKTPDQWCRLISDGIDMLTRPLLERAERAEADAAVMRKAIGELPAHPRVHDVDYDRITVDVIWGVVIRCIEAAKANAGQQLLDELARLREACEEVYYSSTCGGDMCKILRAALRKEPT
jgi:hypothetical protein